MRKLKDINESLPELLIGIVVFGLLVEFVPVWFVEDKLGYTIGTIAGVLTALAVAFHMAWSLDKSFDYDEGGAVKHMQKNSALRYGGQLIVLGVLMVTGWGNPISAFFGMFGLKVSAYIAPLTHKLFRR